MFNQNTKMFTGPIGPGEVFFTGLTPFLRTFTGLGLAVHCYCQALYEETRNFKNERYQWGNLWQYKHGKTHAYNFSKTLEVNSYVSDYIFLSFPKGVLIAISVVPINQLIRDPTILTSNLDDQSQFLKTKFFSIICI